MKVLVTGDRNWNNFNLVTEILKGLGPLTTIIHGGARGADSIANYVAKQLNYNIKVYPAKWDELGKSAGPIRNQQMLDENSDIDLVIAFHNFLANSKGTKDMVTRAKVKRIPVQVIREEDYPDVIKKWSGDK